MAGGGHNFFERAVLFAAQLGETHLLVPTVGLVAIMLLVLGERMLPGRPVALGVVALSIIVASVLGLSALGVPTTGEIPAGLPSLRAPGAAPARCRGHHTARRRLPAACLYRRRVRGSRVRRQAPLCTRPATGAARHWRRQSGDRAGTRLFGRRWPVTIRGKRQSGRSVHHSRWSSPRSRSPCVCSSSLACWQT